MSVLRACVRAYVCVCVRVSEILDRTSTSGESDGTFVSSVNNFYFPDDQYIQTLKKNAA